MMRWISTEPRPLLLIILRILILVGLLVIGLLQLTVVHTNWGWGNVAFSVLWLTEAGYQLFRNGYAERPKKTS